MRLFFKLVKDEKLSSSVNFYGFGALVVILLAILCTWAILGAPAIDVWVHVFEQKFSHSLIWVLNPRCTSLYKCVGKRVILDQRCHHARL